MTDSVISCSVRTGQITVTPGIPDIPEWSFYRMELLLWILTDTGTKNFHRAGRVVTAAVIMSRLTYVTSSRRNLNWQM